MSVDQMPDETLADADGPEPTFVEPAAEAPAKRRKRSTSHLKQVPPDLAIREAVRDAAARLADTLDRSRPFSRDELETWSRKLLEDMGLPEGYLGFAMVLVGNYYWKSQFLAVPYHRRMLLLPHCLKHAEGCPAEYDEFGLDCEKCGACSIADYKVRAEQLGYKVLVAEGSPVVLKLIVSGYVDAILGVACLNVLEKAIDKVLIAGVPSFAVPLHSGDCKNTKMDEAWVWEVLEQFQAEPDVVTSSYLPLMRLANEVMEEQFDALAPPVRQPKPAKEGGKPAFASLADTEEVARAYLKHGGKRLRPFLTLAAYEALSRAARAEGDTAPVAIPDHVKRAAIAIEAFHKASLAHDDIEDDDPYRYGQAALHVRHGVGTAINVGDYLIGLGYRLVGRDRQALGGDAAAEILDRLADAHVKLAEGQGAELHWRRSPDKSLRPLDAMAIYALKTSPAFEAALLAGCRLFGPTDALADKLGQFARQLGVGFQILNDLADWRGDDDNKLAAAQDAAHLRPTLLLALALESATGRPAADLAKALLPDAQPAARILTMRRVFDAVGAFAKAEKLLDKCRERCEQIADTVEPDALRQLLYYVTDTLLAVERDETRQAAGPLQIISIG